MATRHGTSAIVLLSTLSCCLVPISAPAQSAWEQYRDSANLAIARQDTAATLDYLDNAVQAHPNTAALENMDYDRDFLVSEDLAELYDWRGELLTSRGRYEEAGTSFTYSLYFYDMNASVWYRRGVIWWDLTLWENALNDLNEAIALDSTLHEAWGLRARLHAMNNDYAEAVKDLTAAIELTSGAEADYPEYYEERSTAWQQLGEPGKADADARKALQLRGN